MLINQCTIEVDTLKRLEEGSQWLCESQLVRNSLVAPRDIGSKFSCT